MENVRYNISPCTAGEVSEFIQRIDSDTFVPNGNVRASERSHYDRYSFLVEDNRVAVVYDTSASILSITGRSDFAKCLLDLFVPDGKTVKRSTVPAQGTVPTVKHDQHTARPEQSSDLSVQAPTENGARRAKLFVSADSIRRRTQFAPVPTIFASAKGVIMSTDEIYPPQTSRKKSNRGAATDNSILPPDDGDVIYPPQVVRKRALPSYGESRVSQQPLRSEFPPLYGVGQSVGPQTAARFSQPVTPRVERQQTEHGSDSGKAVGIAISVGGRATGSAAPRRAVISFGTEDDGKVRDGELKISTRSQSATAMPQQSGASQTEKRKRGRPPKSKPEAAAMSQQVGAPQTEKRKRGRPPKGKAQNDIVGTVETVAPEYKNGYSVKNFPPEALTEAVNKLNEYGKTVTGVEVEFNGTPQEVKSYTVTDCDGQRVILRYATKRMTLQLQGKRSNLFGEVMSLVSSFSDYSSALENYVEESGGGKKVSDIQNKLKKRLPAAYGFLSEQSRIDFSYGIHDFSQASLTLSDYSVLLVPAFRGLERFVFDLQNAEGIKVKMIGQAFDKDDSGKYILKSGYTQRIGSVIYAEVLVSLYTEYFAQRNFFAHSDNTDSNTSRSIPERAVAQRIFDHLLDVVEYNAKKLKEIGFKISK